eukprot:gene12721-biopygen18509
MPAPRPRRRPVTPGIAGLGDPDSKGAWHHADPPLAPRADNRPAGGAAGGGRRIGERTRRRGGRAGPHCVGADGGAERGGPVGPRAPESHGVAGTFQSLESPGAWFRCRWAAGVQRRAGRGPAPLCGNSRSQSYQKRIGARPASLMNAGGGAGEGQPSGITGFVRRFP